MEVVAKPQRTYKRRFKKRPREKIRPRKPTPRMDRILLLLHEYRFLRAGQIEDLLAIEGYSKQTTSRLLSHLHDLDLVDKPEKSQRLKWRTGGGSSKEVYALGNKGGEYLENTFGIPQSSARWRDKNRQVKYVHIEHTLLDAEIMMAFERACAARKDVRLIYPREILQFAPEKTRAERKPFEWRTETQWEGTKLRLSVAPDRVFGLEFLRVPERNLLWFMLEADTGSETIKPLNLKNISKTNLFHKYLGYRATYSGKLHQERFDAVHSFRVLTVTAKDGVQVSHDRKTGTLIRKTRIENMQEAARLAGGEIVERNPGFFLFADLQTLQSADDVLTMAWRTAHPRKTAILDLKR